MEAGAFTEMNVQGFPAVLAAPVAAIRGKAVSITQPSRHP
jgi:hypothetical protein